MLTTMLAILAIAVMNVQCLDMSENKEDDHAKRKRNPDHDRNDIRSAIKELTQRVNGLSSGLISMMKRVDEMAKNQMSVSRKVDEIKSGQLSLSSKVDNITCNQVSLSNKVDKINDNQMKLSRKVDEIGSEVRKFHPITTQASTAVMTTSTTHDWVYYPRGTHDHRARRFYPVMNLTFIGYGYVGNRSDLIRKHTKTFEGCMSFCWQVRKDKGDDWNGLEYNEQLGAWCCCNKHETGHHDSWTFLHYRFHV